VSDKAEKGFETYTYIKWPNKTAAPNRGYCLSYPSASAVK